MGDTQYFFRHHFNPASNGQTFVEGAGGLDFGDVNLSVTGHQFIPISGAPPVPAAAAITSVTISVQGANSSEYLSLDLGAIQAAGFNIVGDVNAGTIQRSVLVNNIPTWQNFAFYTAGLAGQSLQINLAVTASDPAGQSTSAPAPSAELSALDQILDHVVYWTGSQNPPTSRTIQYSFGGTYAFGTPTVTVAIQPINSQPALVNTATANLGTLGELAGSAFQVSSFRQALSDADGPNSGIAITGATGNNGRWEYRLDGTADWIAVGAVGGNSSLLLKDTDWVRFVGDGSVAGGQSASNTITYRAWDQSGGAAGTRVDTSSPNGQSPYSSSTASASLTITGVNAAPALSGGTALSTIDEDQAVNAGQTVASFRGTISDIDNGALKGIAITGITSGNGHWEYKLNGATDWVPFGTIDGSNTLLLRDNDLVRFIPDGENGTSASLTYAAWDQASGTAGAKVVLSATGGTTAFSATSSTADLTVTSVNDAPTATGLSQDLTIDEDTPTGPLGIQVTDVDANETITATLKVANPAAGSLSIAGGGSYDAGMGIWTISGSVAAVNAALAAVTFIPAPNSSVATTITTQIRDAAGTGPDGTISIAITETNDAPTVTGATQSHAYAEGDTSVTLDPIVIADNDAGDIVTVTLTLAHPAAGTLASLAGGDFSAGVWTYIGTVAQANAALLAVSFTPATDNDVDTAITVHVEDADGAGPADGTITLDVTPVDDLAIVTVAPVTTTEAKLPSFVFFNIASKVTIVDVDTYDAAHPVKYVAGSGVVTFDGPPPPDETLADLLTLDPDTGTVLYDRSAFRWLADDQHVTYTITFQVQSGDDAPQTATLTVTINGLNDAPVLSTPTHASFAAISEDDAASVARGVASFRGPVTDGDPDALTGIAITSTQGLGDWQYSLDGGAHWVSFSACPTEALLLRDSDLLRFAPDGRNGATASFTYRAWDQTTAEGAGETADASQTGGATAFSNTSDVVTLAVASINDAPVMTPEGMTLLPITEDETADAGQPVWQFLCTTIGDVDDGAVPGIALTGATNGNGHWEYSLDGGSNWIAVGTLSESAALLLRADDWMRFVPDGKNGTSATLTYHAWDRTAGTAGGRADLSGAGGTGGTTAFSTLSDTVSIAVSDLNDTPAVTGPVTLAAMAEDSGTRLITQAELLAHASDVDTADTLSAIGLAIESGSGLLTDNGDGTWSYKPALDDDTSVTFSYSVQDGHVTVPTTATLDITPVNDAPLSQNDILGGDEDTVLGGSLSASDVDSQSLAYSLATPAAHGIVTVDPGGSYTYKPNADYNGQDSFTFKVDDGFNSSFGTVDLVVNAINDAPVNIVPVGLTVEAGLDIPLTGLSVSDVDAGSGTMTTTLKVSHGTLNVGAVGSVVVAGSGGDTVTLTGTLAQINAALAAAKNVIYRAADDFSGADTLVITTSDAGHSGAGTALSDVDNVPLAWQHLSGDNGNNTFTALPGYERIDAGAGNDTITFNFKLTDATFTWVGNQVIVDTANSHTALSGFETYVFTDGTVNNNDGDVLVDDLHYYATNHDVWNAHADADAHYHGTGWREGRDPNAFFSTAFYLAVNADVKKAGVDPLIHFHQSGWQEGRQPSMAFDTRAYLAANPDVAAAHVDPLAHFLQNGAAESRQPIALTSLIGPAGFDYVYYLQHNPDVAAAGIDPLWHFQATGWKEGRDPNALFDVKGYLATYTDVAAAGINPLDHYNLAGWLEERDPSVGFDTSDYLSLNPDVAAAHINPLTHYLMNGIHEGRLPMADGIWG